MPTWFRRLALVVMFWSYVWLLGSIAVPLLHPEGPDETRKANSQQQAQIDQPVASVGGFLDWLFGDAIKVYTLVLTGATVLLWRRTSALAQSTKDLATEAKAQRGVSEDAAQRQLRAYVSALGILTYNTTREGDPEQSWRFRVSWANTGTTPTQNMMMYIGGIVSETMLPTDYDFTAEEGGLAAPVPGSMGPHSTVQSGVFPRPSQAAITLTQARAMGAGNLHLYVWGSAKYRDVFPGSKPHITRFAWEIIASDIRGEPPVVTFGNGYLIRGNCTDDECALHEQGNT